jgi:hypothetical protein
MRVGNDSVLIEVDLHELANLLQWIRVIECHAENVDVRAQCERLCVQIHAARTYVYGKAITSMFERGFTWMVSLDGSILPLGSGGLPKGSGWSL